MINTQHLIRVGAQSVLTIGVAALALTSCGKRDDGDTSTIDVNGSDTMLQVGLAWAEAREPE